MEVRVVDFVEGARNARGTTVIIDVFRAFSVACYLYEGGVSEIYPTGKVDDALQMGAANPNAILVGERGGRRLEGFDFGNSPSELISADFSGRPAVHTTHAGTQGIVNAVQASEVLTGALVNARATCNYILDQAPDQVTLVRMGLEATSRTDEDDLCASYMGSLLTGAPYDVESIRPSLERSSCSNRFFDDLQPWSPEQDFYLCTEVDRFDFVIRAVTRRGGEIALEKII